MDVLWPYMSLLYLRRGVAHSLVCLSLAACASAPAAPSATDSDPARSVDAGTGGSSDDGDHGASDPATKHDAGGSPPTGNSGRDASAPPSVRADGGTLRDASAPVVDASRPASPADAGGSVPTKLDAGASADAGTPSASTPDASTPPRDAGGLSDAGASVGQCAGDTPHGCYVPQSDNPDGCPPQIHEQSSYYPPMSEWVACSSPFYVSCNYQKPGASALSHCECDLGLHWLCTY